MFSPNLDGDNVDASGRRKDGCHRTAQKVRPSSAVLLALGGWCGTAFRRGHYLQEIEVSKIFQKWPQKVTGSPEMAFGKEMEEKTN